MLRRIKTVYRNLAYMNFLKHNPRVYWKLIKGYSKVNFFNKNQVRFVEIMLTYGCNARCYFCSCKALLAGGGKLLTKEKTLSVIDECADMGVPVVSFLGGEPLLIQHLPDLIAHTARRGILPGITTNASLLTKEKLKNLYDAGLGFMSVSIHSTDPSEHDNVVKIPNAFEHAMEMLDEAKRLGIAVNISSVFMHQTFASGQAEKIVELARRRGYRLSINNLIPAVQGDLTSGILMTLSDNQRLAALAKEHPFITTHMTNNFFGYGCPIGNCYIGLSAYGDALPCFFVPISFGNVWDDSLKNIFERMLKVRVFRSRPKMCLAGENKTFITRYLAPIFGVAKSAPVPVEKHPEYDSTTGTLRDLVASAERTAANHIAP